MSINLNDLTNEEMIKLEKYVLQRNNAIEIKLFFESLKSGKLKNKNVDIDALDFVYEGLSDLVEDYIKKHENPNEQKTNIEIQTEFKQSLKRSTNLSFKRQLKSNNKFILGDYIILLHGDKRNKVGLYTNSFIQEGINLSEYLSKHKDTNIDELAYVHSIKGNGRFISASTSLVCAEQFAAEYDDGSIYVIKIKKENAYRVKSAIDDLVEQTYFKWSNVFNEYEYLIPDCVFPDEIMQEFKCYEHRKIFDYLTSQLGLSITPQDIGLPEISERFERIKRQQDEEYLKVKKQYSSSLKTDTLPDNSEDFKKLLEYMKGVLGTDEGR